MRKWLLALVAVLAVLLVPAGASAEQQELVGVQYTSWGPSGLLTFQAAMGEQFSVTDSAGHVIAAGTVPMEWFTIPAINTGPDAAGVLLTVNVGGRIFFVANEWWLWE